MSTTASVIKCAGLYVNAVAIAATPAEINARCDDSAMTETIASAGAVSLTVAESRLALSGAGAVTLAAPTKPGFVKVITMTADNGDVTLALTNVVGGTAATTCTFDDAGDALILVADTGASKWIVLKEKGVTMS
jgi:hypothetical protein